jgi:hypothetical protein
MSQIQAFDYSVDLMQSILWQYNDAENLIELLQQKQDWYNANQTEFWQNWYDDVFNLQTANNFGCAVWAIILDIPISYETAPPPAADFYFGFDEYNSNFDNSNFASNDPLQPILTLSQKRLVLRLRYFQLVTNGVIPDINRFIQWLFADDGNVYVVDNLDMSMTYVFEFQPSDDVLFVLNLYDILPRPAGVSVSIVIDV